MSTWTTEQPAESRRLSPARLIDVRRKAEFYGGGRWPNIVVRELLGHIAALEGELADAAALESRRLGERRRELYGQRLAEEARR